MKFAIIHKWLMAIKKYINIFYEGRFDLRDNRVICLAVACVIFTLHPILYIRLLGWLILSFMIFNNVYLGFVLTFFFAPFFWIDFFWYDFANFKLYFTLKPFQIAFFITAFTLCIKPEFSFKEFFRSFFKNSENLFLLIFILCLYISIVTGDYKIKSLRLSINFTLLAAWYFLTVSFLKDKVHIKKCIYAAVTGYLVLLSYENFKALLCGFENIHNGHNLYSNVLLLFSYTTVAFFVLEKSRILKAVWLFFFGLSVANIFIAFSRAAIVAFAVSFIFMLAFLVLKKKILQAIMLAGIVLFCFLTIYRVNIFFKSSVDVISKIAEAAVDKNVDFQYTLRYQLSEGRTEPQDYIINYLKSKPFIGVGLAVNKLGPHNFYLELCYATGIIGGGAFFIFLLLWFYRVVVDIIRNYNSSYIYLQAAFLCSIIAWLIQSLAETYLLQFYIWTTLAAGVMIRNIKNKDEYEKSI